MLVTYKKVYVTNITQPDAIGCLARRDELADERSARSALTSLVIGAPSL